MAPLTLNLPSRYRDVEPVARGAMGDIYRATDSSLGRVVAIKVLAEPFVDDQSVRQRFQREARAAARLSSDPNIVTIYDVGDADGRPYIVMQFMGGGSLEDRLQREGAQAPERALAWLDQAARALDHAHAEGVIHRDVKPGNLLLDARESVHVADFGIASAAGLASLTVTGTVLGTAGYLAPEQATGAGTTPASDRYALGVVAFELLTGERPFARETASAEAAAHVNEPVPPIGDRSNLPRAVDAVFARALAKDPAARYGSCVDFVAALRAALTKTTEPTRVLPATPPGAPPATRRTRGATPWWPLAAAAAGAAIVAAVLLAVLLPRGGEGTAQTRTRTPARTTTKTGAVTTRPATTRPATTSPTTTAAAPAAPPTTTPTATAAATTTPTTTAAATTAPTVSSTDPHTLNDRAWALMKQGRYEEALPLLQQAVPALAGSGPGDLYEGYANYNLGYTLLQLGRCSEAEPYLQHAKELEPDRTEVDKALKELDRCLGRPK